MNIKFIQYHQINSFMYRLAEKSGNRYRLWNNKKLMNEVHKNDIKAWARAMNLWA